LAFVEGGEIRERFASALGASKTLKSLDVAFCSEMLKVDELCTLLQSNEVLKSLTVCSRFAESRPVAGRYTSLRVMLEQNSTLKRSGIAHLDEHTWDLTELAGVLGSQSLLEQLSIEFHDGDLPFRLEKIFEMLEVNTNLSNPNNDCKIYIQNFRIKINDIPCHNLCRLTCHLWMKFIHEHSFLSIVVKFIYHIHFPISHNSYFHSYSWMHSCLTIICHNLHAHCENFWVMLVSCSCWLLEAMHH
jgi:hypothetical protein